MSSSSLSEGDAGSSMGIDQYGDFSEAQIAELVYTAVRRRRKANSSSTRKRVFVVVGTALKIKQIVPAAVCERHF